MLPIKQVSFESLLKDTSRSFLDQEQVACPIMKEGLSELICQLFDYKEEGKVLYPEVYIFDNLELIEKILPNSQFLHVETGEKSKSTILKALKKCAPLAANEWLIYIFRKEDTFDFGVFRAGKTIVSVPVSDVLNNSSTDELHVISIRQVAERLIEVKGVKTEPLLICSGSSESIEISPIACQLEFIKSIVSKVHFDLSEQVINFYKRVFMDVLQKGHGTLACTMSYRKKLSDKFRDGIVLKERISVPEIVQELKTQNDIEANTKLNGYMHLISGMLQSDGVTIFTNRGEIVAYNVFVKHSTRTSDAVSMGGARSRAFHSLSRMLPKEIKSVYMQSQDGRVEFKNEE